MSLDAIHLLGGIGGILSIMGIIVAGSVFYAEGELGSPVGRWVGGGSLVLAVGSMVLLGWS